MKTLAEAQKWEKARPDEVRIQREVRYYAFVGGVRYELVHDWTVQELEQRLWCKDPFEKKLKAKIRRRVA